MIFRVNNLGPIQNAEIALGELTIVCGSNNNGKTYLTYTLASFLSTIKSNLSVAIPIDLIDLLIGNGEIEIDLTDYVDRYVAAVRTIVPLFRENLPRFLAMSPERFSSFDIDIDITNEEVIQKLALLPNSSNETMIQIARNANIRVLRSSESTLVRIILENRGETLPSRRAIESAMSFIMGRMYDDIPWSPIFPDVFAITCERTGAMLFRNELARMRLARFRHSNVVERQSRSIEAFAGYQKPVVDELDFIMDMSRIYKQMSPIAASNPEILQLLAQISGGEYGLDPNQNQVIFSPSIRPELALQLAESSSTVRSMAELNFYLRHRAKPGELLIFDEPELNLHPQNQRLLARLLVMLINAGLRVFITTHSDYILREINALTRLNASSNVRRNSVLERHGIPINAMIPDDKVRIYVLRNGEAEAVEFDSLARAFSVPSFDTTIEDFNRLYDDVAALEFVDSIED